MADAIHNLGVEDAAGVRTTILELSEIGAKVLRNLLVNGDLSHKGLKVGLYGVDPVVRSATYAVANVVADRSYDADLTSLNEIADVLGTLIADLRASGMIG